MEDNRYLNLYRKIWITRGCRFQAHKRLNSSDDWSSWTVNILTVYIISLSIFSLKPSKSFLFLTQETSSIFLICVSILLLVLSILETSKSYKLRADSMHRCGKELSSIYNDICQIRDKVIADGIEDKLIAINARYQEIINKYDDNHIPIDYEMFKADNYKDFGLKRFNKFYLEALYFIKVKGKYLLLILIPLAVFIILALR